MTFEEWEKGLIHGLSSVQMRLSREAWEAAVLVERERCAKYLEESAKEFEEMAVSDPDNTAYYHQNTLLLMTMADHVRDGRHPTAPASGTDPGPAER